MGDAVIHSYKGMNKDMKCRGFQYVIGKTYETDKAECCNTGFHTCEFPLDVFSYYPPSNNRFFSVEQSGNIDRSDDDSKIASTKLTVNAEIGIPGLVKAHVEHVKAHTTNEHTDENAATAGYKGAATSRGKSTVGENGIACACGIGVKLRGGIGALLVIAKQNEDDYDIACWKAFVVDGKTYKADTWYTLRNGKIVEAEDEK